jgi:hypothetical protein
MSRVPEWQVGIPAPWALGESQVFVCGDEREIKLYGSLVAPSPNNAQRSQQLIDSEVHCRLRYGLSGCGIGRCHDYGVGP